MAKLSASAELATKSGDESDDDLSITSSTATSVKTGDGVKEVQNMSKKENMRVSMWRSVVAGMLLLTSVSVTYTTYRFLKKEEQNNFETAFEQFSRTVIESALNQQQNIEDAFSSISDTLTTYAIENNMKWPYVTIPLFQSYAEHALKQGGIEVMAQFPLITPDNRDAWIEYANGRYESWIKKGHLIESGNLDRFQPVGYKPFISKRTEEGFVPETNNQAYTLPFWHYSPPPSTYGFVNFNLVAVPDYANIVKALLELRNETLITRVRPYISVPTAMTEEQHNALHDNLPNSSSDHPHSIVLRPLYKGVKDSNSEIVGMVGGGIAWDRSLRDLLPESVEGLISVIHNSCNQTYTYEINGHDAIYIGEGDRHEQQYNSMKLTASLALNKHPNVSNVPGHCQYSMTVYPSSRFQAIYDSNTPEVYATVVAITFGLVTAFFFIYDSFVRQRNDLIVNNAARSNAIVSSLFPNTIRDRLLEFDGTGSNKSAKGQNNLKAFMNHNTGLDDMKPGISSNPLAELFLETTVLFGDVAGFTAWSSVREPTQVFTLLENIYSAFDKIAKRRQIFKVETVGDCYVAVAGLPNARHDHAVVMVRFARDIMNKMSILTKELEVTLGPDTGDLNLRIGIHSGPVTGGVLRGERSRFQLFGDTMNTAARIESTGKQGKIQISQETATLMINAGKGDWIQQREETVTAKGKGEIVTYWVNLRGERDDVGSTGTRTTEPSLPRFPSTVSDPTKASSEAAPKPTLSTKTARLIDWNVEILLRLLRQIIARQNASHRNESSLDYDGSFLVLEKGGTPLEEVKEIIELPEFDGSIIRRQQDPNKVELPSVVVQQLQKYVTSIASMYRDNPFHNFDHASHVVMSVTKLMSRIVAPTDLDLDDEGANERRRKKKVAATLHDHTYGITSDPLTQFACALSALIHDVDHTGVPNTQLIKENAKIVALYKNRSVAEQNSLDLSWDLLMSDEYEDLRAALYSTKEELRRFRHLVVNSVMATDIVDKDLKTLRNARWDVAFKSQHQDEPAAPGHSSRDDINRKATIVIEHLIQASDVAHTMQHWHIYRRWNEKFFVENYEAFKAGRAEKNPASFWYKGELGFFDFYIIPLAKKLKDCGVFGVSSDEYLNYAINNRKEWEEKGHDVVAEMVQKYCK